MMKFIKLALIAIILFLGCSIANAQLDTPDVTSEHHVVAKRSRCSAPKPTSAPTPAPTQRATPAPTQRATPAPTQRPTPAPTQKATPAPTQRPPTAPTTRPVGLCDIVSTKQEPLKLLVPLYVWPDASWDLIAAGGSKVPTIAIINPNSGPRDPVPSAYVSGMDKLRAARVEMIGYVHTSYATRSIVDVKKDIDVYVAKYPYITGIFFDEASASAGDIPYYREAYNYVMSKGYKHSILNPGVVPAQGYVDISSNIVIFEEAGSLVPQRSNPSWVTCAPNAAQKSGYKYKFSGIAHSTKSSSAANTVLSNMANRGMGLIYVTDGDSGCCTYNKMVSYYSSQVSYIQSLNN